MDIYTRETEAIGLVQCSGACAVYICGTTEKVDDEGLPDNMIAGGGGCPEDFFHECAKFVNEIDFIKNNDENDIDYYNGYVLYVSGCGDEIDPTICFQAKITHFVKKIKNKKDFKLGEFIWNPSDNLVRRNTALKNENDAIKFIGIFAFTWIIYTFV
uniref:Uncharacterized protein n=1 Tax=Panagrolaimus davidi TaxID=227884 RepID=A0A914PE75_9BILA